MRTAVKLFTPTHTKTDANTNAGGEVIVEEE